MSDLLTNLAAAAGAAGGDGTYIEDVFSTYLYTGNNSTQTITNGIDLDGEGGMLWLKSRSSTADHTIQDTVRGNRYQLLPSSVGTSNINSGPTVGVTSFTSSGFTLGTNYQGENPSGASMCSWTFRKAPKFFDVLTYTGTGANQTVSHNLGSVPGCIIVKRMDANADWQVYHRANTANPETDYLVLNSTAATADSDTRWNDTLPTDSVFTVGTDATVNASGGTYVAYLFAHDAGGFGDDGEQNVISCGSFTTSGAGTASVTLGYEPQWLMLKNTTSVDNWYVLDNMRGFGMTQGNELKPNSSAAEGSYFSGGTLVPTATGFNIPVNIGASQTWVYIAIRRGPMKTPTSGTEVFGLSARTGTGANATVTGSAGVSDAVLVKNRGSAVASLFAARLTGTNYLVTSTTAAQVAAATTILQANPWDVMDGVKVGTTSTITNASANTFINYLFSRAPGFFDVVCYSGTGVVRTVAHNLGVAPKLILIKRRDSSTGGVVYSLPTSKDNALELFTSNASSAKSGTTDLFNNTDPTASVFSVGTASDVNNAVGTYIAYLFASLAGVSDIGTYTGNGSSVTVTTGFQPRFILVKRTDSTGEWIAGDSARGLPAGDDPAWFLSTNAAETTGQDWVDVSATGFTVNETALNANVNTGIYLYLAIS